MEREQAKAGAAPADQDNLDVEANADAKDARQIQALRHRRMLQRATDYHQRHELFVREFNALTGGACAGGQGGVDYRKVRLWQKERGLRVDGLVGPQTLGAARQAGGAAADAGGGKADAAAGASGAAKTGDAAGGGKAGAATAKQALPEEPSQEDAAAADSVAGPANEDAAKAPPKVPLAGAYKLLAPALKQASFLRRGGDPTALLLEAGRRIFESDGTIRAALLERDAAARQALAFLAAPGASWEDHPEETQHAFELLIRPIVEQLAAADSPPLTTTTTTTASTPPADAPGA